MATWANTGASRALGALRFRGLSLGVKVFRGLGGLGTSNQITEAPGTCAKSSTTITGTFGAITSSQCPPVSVLAGSNSGEEREQARERQREAPRFLLDLPLHEIELLADLLHLLLTPGSDVWCLKEALRRRQQ